MSDEDLIPWEDVPDSTVVPADTYLLAIEELRDGESSTGKRMFSLVARIEEPADYAGVPYYENYVVGTDQDTRGTNPVTWKRSFGAISLKKMLAKANIALGPASQICQQATGMKFVAAITQRVDNQGTVRNRVQTYFAVGEAPVGQPPPPPVAAGTGRRTTQPHGTRNPNPPTAPASSAPAVGVAPKPTHQHPGRVVCGSCGESIVASLLASHRANDCVAAKHEASMQAQEPARS